MTAFFHHLTYDFKTGLRDKSMMLLYYIFPLIFYGFMGVLMTGINPDFKYQIGPAMITFAILSGSLLGLPNPFVTSREAGIFRSFKINGVPAMNIVSVPVDSAMVHMMIVSVIIILTCGPLFGGSMPVRWFPLVCLALLSCYSIASLGALIGVIAPNSRAVVLISQAIYLPSIMLGGLMMPVRILPEALQKVAALFPATHAMNAMYTIGYNHQSMIDPLISIAALFAGGIIAMGLAVYLFNWDSKNTGKRRSPFLALLALVPYVVAAVLLA